MITRPMLAGTLKDLNTIRYPVLVTPKLDGIRALMIDGKLVSRNFKPIPNNYVRTMVETYFPNGVDGELIVEGKSFQETTSAVMSEDGKPQVTYCIFDFVSRGVGEEYYLRMAELHLQAVKGEIGNCNEMVRTRLILPIEISDEKELLEYEQKCLSEGYEGVMLRSPNGPYKCGRSTVNEGYLLKLKRFQDAEAWVTGFEERMHNANVETKNAFGRAEHSSHKAGMVPVGTLGALVVIEGEMEFKIGSGFTDEQRREIWNHRSKYLGKMVKYKSQKQGSKNVPRFPIFLAFRDERDMSE